MHLRTDSLVTELRRIVPELRVAGGSFAHWLPQVRDVARAERTRLLMAAQSNATGKCLTDLVANAGLPVVEPARLASGARDWPVGHTGSVSHKGTTVVAAIASTDQMTSIGIDVERRDAKRVPAVHGLNASEQPWSVPEADGLIILFSVKEAVDKALHPILGYPLDFADVTVSWLPPNATRSRGVARACGIDVDVRCSIAVPSWVVSAALWPVTAERSHTTSRASSGQSPTIV